MDPERARTLLEAERDRLRSLRQEREETADLDESQEDSTGTLSSVDQHPGDVGTDTFERSKELAIQDQIEDRLGEIEAALQRLDSGQYGRCEVCGRPIDPARLEARPEARYCVDHQRTADEAQRMDRER